MRLMKFERLAGMPREKAEKKTENEYERTCAMRDALRKELKELKTFLNTTEKIPKTKQGEIRLAISKGEHKLNNLHGLLENPLTKEHIKNDATEGAARSFFIPDPRASSIKESMREANSSLEEVRKQKAELDNHAID